jgi:hypothetical protein
MRENIAGAEASGPGRMPAQAVNPKPVPSENPVAAPPKPVLPAADPAHIGTEYRSRPLT